MTCGLNNIFTACTVGLDGLHSRVRLRGTALRESTPCPLGQAEAARAIGLPFVGVMRNVVLPQAFRAAIPPLANVQIALLKNTTVAGALGVLEAAIQMRGLLNDYSGATGSRSSPPSPLIFVVLVEVLSFVANRLERRVRIT